jgi:hypothetical protein
MLLTDTRFPLRTDDHILIVTEQDVHLEQMKLEALRAEDELKNQQKLHAIQWTMADLPPRPASREVLTLTQVFTNPPPESLSKWGEDIAVRFEDISGTQGSRPTGCVYTTKEGERWERAASEAFGIPMQVVDTRTDIEGESDVVLKCRPVFGTDEMTAPISAPGRRQFMAGTSYPVHIKLQFKDRNVPLEVLSSAPTGCVELQARIHFGAVVEFSQPKPTSWTPGRIYQMRRVTSSQERRGTSQATPPGSDVKVRMTVKYSRVRVSIPNITLPRTASARDVINAWLAAVESQQIKDPNVLCLFRDPEAYDIRDEDGERVLLEEGEEVFIIPLNKTSPEVMIVDVTWDGFDESGQSLKLSISPTVHRDAPRSRLLALWIEHYKAHPKHAEVASHFSRTRKSITGWTRRELRRLPRGSLANRWFSR